LKKRRQNEKKELEFELTMNERRMKKKEMKLKSTLNDFQTSIQSFENRLSTTNTLKPPQLKDQKTFIAKIKTKKQTEIIARKDRDQRRRKMLIDQNKMMESLEQQRRKDLKLQTLRQESREERQLVKRLAETMKWKTVMKRNREFRQQQYEEQQQLEEQMRQESTQMERQQRDEERLKQQELLLKRFEERQVQRQQKQEKKNEALCENVVRQLVTLAEKEIEYKEITEGESPKAHEKAEWKQTFVKGVDEEGSPHERENGATSPNPLQEEEGVIEPPTDDLESSLREPKEISELLDEKQFLDYTLSRNTWAPPVAETDETANENDKKPQPASLTQNQFLPVALTTIETIINPPPQPADASAIPFKSRCAIRVSVLGKPFSGKTQCCQELAKQFSLAVISPDEILNQSISNPESTQVQDEELLTKINRQLLQGAPVDDELIVQLIMEEIKRVEANDEVNGWILDGYPNSASCALELEKQLAGYQQKTYHPKKSSLLEYDIEDYSDIRHPIKSFAPGVIFLNVSNSEVFHRVTGQRFDPDTQTFYHMTYNPPPADEDLLERLQSIEEVQIDRTQINEQITSFSKNQKKILEFYETECTTPVLNVNADGDMAQIVDELRRMVEQAQEEANNSAQQESVAPQQESELESTPAEGEETEESVPPADVDPQVIAQKLEEEEASIKKELELKKETAELLDRVWYSMENQYADSAKSVFRRTRHNRKLFLHRLHGVKDKFIVHLKEPDVRKQKLLLTFQDDFNRLDQDVRNDDVVKGELHRRLKELREALWGVVEERKSNATNELNSIKKQQWLDEFQVYITRQYMQLVQLEVNRYLHTAKFLTDFYLEKNAQAPPVDAGVFEGLFVDVIGEDSNSKKKGKAAPAKKGKGAADDTYQPEIPANFDETFTRAQAIVDLPINESNDKKKGGAKKKGAGAGEEVAIPELQEAVAQEKKLYLQKLSIIQRVFQDSIQEITNHTSHSFGILEKWINERHQSEMSAIRKMALFVENDIERALPIEKELRLSDDKFGVDEYVRMVAEVESPGEDQSLQPQEKASVDFSLRQMRALVSRFRLAAPSGFISSTDFVTLFLGLSASSFGTADLPEKWLEASRGTFETLSQDVCIPDGSGIINWREFLVNVLLKRFKTAPSSQELLCTLNSFFAIQETLPPPPLETAQESAQEEQQGEEEAPGEDQQQQSEYAELQLNYRLNAQEFAKLSFWFATRRPDNECMTSPEVVESLFEIVSTHDSSESEEPTVDVRDVLFYASLDVVPIKSVKNCIYILSEGSGEGVSAEQLFTMFNFNLPAPAEEFGRDQMEAILEEFSLRKGQEGTTKLTYEQVCDTAFGRSFINQADHLRKKTIEL